MAGVSVTKLVKNRFKLSSLHGGPISLSRLFMLALDAAWQADLKVKLFVMNSVHAFIKILSDEDLSISALFVASSFALALETTKVGYNTWRRVQNTKGKHMTSLKYIAEVGGWDVENLLTHVLSSHLGQIAIAYDTTWSFGDKKIL
eukprot:862360-Rhodomonas_salina.8